MQRISRSQCLFTVVDDLDETLTAWKQKSQSTLQEKNIQHLFHESRVYVIAVEYKK